MTVKQRLYVAGVVAGKSKKQAAKDAGYSNAVAKNPGERLDRKAGVRTLFESLMRQAGATDELMAKRVYQGLHATVVQRETLYARREVLVDFKERREMTELGLRIRGILVDQHEVEPGPTLAELIEASFHA